MSDLGLDNVSSDMVASFIPYLHNMQISRCVAVAALTLCLWDVPITLATEIEYVWQRKGLIIKTLYFLVRFVLSLDLQLG
jgi:hypothetical protein